MCAIAEVSSYLLSLLSSLVITYMGISDLTSSIDVGVLGNLIQNDDFVSSIFPLHLCLSLTLALALRRHLLRI